MTDNAITVKKNTSMQQQLLEMLGEKQPFSPKGIKYLANRALGSKYKKPLFAALNLMVTKKLQEAIPTHIKEQVKTAFAYTKDIEDPAFIIIGTGRRAVYGEKGWSEGGESLLKVDDFPPDAEKLPEDAQEKLVKRITRQQNQMEACTKLMQFFLEQAPEEVVDTPVKKTTVKQPVTKKTATVVSLHKEPKVIPVTETSPVTVEELTAVQNALEPLPEPVIVPEPVVKKVAKKTKATKKTITATANQDIDF